MSFSSIANTQIFISSPVNAFTDAYNKASESIKSSIESNSTFLDSIKNLNNTRNVDYSKITKITNTILNVSTKVDSDSCTIKFKSPIIAKFITANKKNMVAGIVENIGNKLTKAKDSGPVDTSVELLFDRDAELAALLSVSADELTSDSEFDSLFDEYDSDDSLFNEVTRDEHVTLSQQASDEESMLVDTEYEEFIHEESNYDESSSDNEFSSEDSSSDEADYDCNEYFSEVVCVSAQTDENYGTSDNESYYDSYNYQLQCHNMCYDNIAFEESTYAESDYEDSCLDSACFNEEPRVKQLEIEQAETNPFVFKPFEYKPIGYESPVFKLVIDKPKYLELLTEVEKTTDIKKVIIQEYNKLLTKRKKYKPIAVKLVEYKPPVFSHVVVNPKFLELIGRTTDTLNNIRCQVFTVYLSSIHISILACYSILAYGLLTAIKKVISQEFNKLMIKRKAETKLVKPTEYKPPVFKVVVAKPNFLKSFTEIEKAEIKKVIIEEFNKLKKIHPIFKEKVKPVITIPDCKDTQKAVNSRYIWLRLHQILSTKTSVSSQKLELFRLSEYQVENDDIDLKLNPVIYWKQDTKKRENHYEEENTPIIKPQNLKKFKKPKYKNIKTYKQPS